MYLFGRSVHDSFSHLFKEREQSLDSEASTSAANLQVISMFFINPVESHKSDTENEDTASCCFTGAQICVFNLAMSLFSEVERSGIFKPYFGTNNEQLKIFIFRKDGEKQE